MQDDWTQMRLELTLEVHIRNGFWRLWWKGRCTPYPSTLINKFPIHKAEWMEGYMDECV